MSTFQRVLVGLGVTFGLGFCVLGGLALRGFSGYRGEVCTHLGASTVITAHTGALTRCVQQPADAGVSLFEIEGARGKGRALVTSTTDAHGNVTFQQVRLFTDGEEVLVEGT